jgi:hypothetical protein
MTTKADVKRYEALRSLGCIACWISGFNSVVPEIHHLVDKGYRKHSGGNQASIPLCSWHHRGEPRFDRTATYMRSWLGPSMRLESKEFARVYGSQRELLAKVNEMVNA